MALANNIQPFCLLNGKLGEQLFNYTEDELSEFHKAVQPDMLSDVFEAIEAEYNTQHSDAYLSDETSDETAEKVQTIAEYLSCLTPAQLDTFSKFTQLDMDATSAEDDSGKEIDHYSSPRIEPLEGYIAISSSNLQALDKFRDRVINVSALPWEHRIRKHGSITIHSYVFTLDDDNI